MLPDFVPHRLSEIGASQTLSAHSPISQHRPRRQASAKPVLGSIYPSQPLSVAAVDEVGSGVGGRGYGLGSPISERQGTGGSTSRKRDASLAGLDSSPGTIESPEADASEDGHHHDDRRKQPLKRACNECRQQKVSHRKSKWTIARLASAGPFSASTVI